MPFRPCPDPSGRSFRRPRRPRKRAALASSLTPLGALAVGLGLAGAAGAQTVPETPVQALPDMTVQDNKARSDAPKDNLRVYRTGVAKGEQELRDIPQSITVLTEKLIEERNIDNLREALHAVGGVSFLAGETGEEDIRLRGFSLQQAGDIYVDGLRDAPLYDRDTFNVERIEVLKGPASMLFGRGSTGGIVNLVSKKPFLADQNEVEATVGSGNAKRLTGDFNLALSKTSALRLNVLREKDGNWGANVDKTGFAPSLSWGVGTQDAFNLSLYYLETKTRPLYNQPWLLSGGPAGSTQHILPVLPAKNYYGMASDKNDSSAHYGTFEWVHAFGGDAKLKTTVRYGEYQRDLWASVIRFAPAAQQPGGIAITRPDQITGATVLSRSGKGRYGDSRIAIAQSEYTDKLQLAGLSHELLAGVEWSQENAARNNNIPGTAARPNTTVGTPNDGAWIADNRVIPLAHFDTRNLSVYGQDVVGLTSQWKLVGGVRFDRFRADYRDVNGAGKPVDYDLWSPRLGLLFQPNDWATYYASYGYSYNTSGDTYGYAVNTTLSNSNLRLLNTPPEKTRNFEVGSKFELLGGNLFAGAALFYTEKYNERNTDPDSAATQELLSGKRHAAGLELDVAGRLSPRWDAFVSYTFIPSAKVDQAVPTTSTTAIRQGDRPGLTPRHSGSVWTTYALLDRLRVGAGVNFRSSVTPLTRRDVVAPGYATVDVMAQYLIDATWTAKLYVKNLADKTYVDSLYTGFYAPGAPRTVQLSLTASF